MSASSLQGYLLVAAPELRDPNFHRAVVLMVRHDQEEGALGVILNRPSGTSVQEVWKEVSQTPCESTARLHLGGPVAGPLMALHGQPFESEMEVLPGLHFSADLESLQKLLTLDEQPLKLFVGYAGWSPGQLEAELQQGSWRVGPASLEQVFDQGDSLWEQSLRQIAGAQMVELLGIKHVPPDPTMN
ncbi:MAG: YqgE/AlgH family protein [Pirellulales bacterium]